MTLIPAYRPKASALHAARAAVSVAYCAAFVLTALLFWRSPAIAAAVVTAVLIAAAGARVLGEVARMALLALPFIALTVLVNVLVSTEGVTILVRGFTLFGHRFDVTLESVVWGAVTGLSIAALFLVFDLYTAAVDPDEVLRLLRRISPRSALTASLATRLVSVLERDARRIADAASCRTPAPGRFALTRAALDRSLERALDVAVALEVRGYSLSRPPARARRPWSRHDLRIGGAALLLALAAVAAKAAGAGAVHSEPTFTMTFGPAEALLVGVLLVAGAAPFAGASSRLGVARA